MAQEQLEAPDVSHPTWGAARRLNFLRGSAPQALPKHELLLYCQREAQSTRFYKQPPLPLSPEFRVADQKAAVGHQCPLMLLSLLTWGKGPRAFVLAATAEISKPSFAISAPTVIFPCPQMHSQNPEFPRPVISVLSHRCQWCPQPSLHLPLIWWPQVRGRVWDLLSPRVAKNKTSGMWERDSRKAHLGSSLAKKKQANGLILYFYHQSWEQSCTSHW